MAHVYFDYKERDHQKQAQVLSSIVCQLAAASKQNIPPDVEKLYDASKEQNSKPPTIDELYSILSSVMKSFGTSQPYVVFDALDECDKNDQRQKLLPLFEKLADEGLKLFMTSRPYPDDIENWYQRMAEMNLATNIELTANPADLRKYLQEAIKTSSRGRDLICKNGHEEKVIEGVISCAKGM